MFQLLQEYIIQLKWTCCTTNNVFEIVSKDEGTHGCYTCFLSILRHRNMCLDRHTFPYSYTWAHTHLKHILSLFFLSYQHKANLTFKKEPTFLTPLSSVSFRTGAHVVSHALTPVFTGRTAHSCNTWPCFNCQLSKTVWTKI